MFKKIFSCIMSLLMVSCVSNQGTVSRIPSEENICHEDFEERQKSYFSQRILVGDQIVYVKTQKSKENKDKKISVTVLSKPLKERGGKLALRKKWSWANAKIVLKTQQETQLNNSKKFILTVVGFGESNVVVLESPSGEQYSLLCLKYVSFEERIKEFRHGKNVKCTNAHLSSKDPGEIRNFYKEVPEELPCKTWLKSE